MIESTIPAIANISIKYGTPVTILLYMLSLVSVPSQIQDAIKYIIELINPNTPAGLLRINERIAHGTWRAIGITNITIINTPPLWADLFPIALPRPEANLPIENTLRFVPSAETLGRKGSKKHKHAIAPVIMYRTFAPLIAPGLSSLGSLAGA